MLCDAREILRYAQNDISGVIQRSLKTGICGERETGSTTFGVAIG